MLWKVKGKRNISDSLTCYNIRNNYHYEIVFIYYYFSHY